MRNKTGEKPWAKQKAIKDRRRTDRDKQDGLSGVDQCSINLAFVTNNLASADEGKEHLEADANSKHCDAEAGGEINQAKLLKVYRI